MAEASGALTIEQAVVSLEKLPRKEPKAEPVEHDAPEPPEDNDIPEGPPEASDTDAPGSPASEGENEDEQSGETEETPELEAIKPPQFWDAEAKKRFGELPRDVQEIISKNEKIGVSATSKKIEEASLRAKAAEVAEQRLTQYTQALDQLIPQAIQTFRSRWDNVDWNAVVDQYGAEEALKLRNSFEQEQGQVQQLVAAKVQADDFQFAKFVENESAKLPELAPDLVDPKQGQERRHTLGNWLLEQGGPHGVTPQLLSNLSAFETSIAYDAYRWRSAEAKAKTLSQQPKQPAPLQRQSVKPTAAPTRGSQQSQRLNELTRKRTLTVDEAVEMRMLKG